MIVPGGANRVEGVVAEVRARAERVRDTLARFEGDVDVWVATAGADGPFLTPLSFWWDGTTFWLSTWPTAPTGRNLLADPKIRLGFGVTRDVVMVDGTAEGTPDTDVDPAVADAFAARTGFDPRAETHPFTYFRVRPERVRAWREANELTGRLLMRDGAWIED
jgi:nitroimidazol reductase NimA-like FMN-containing flavoprotein (pyridoxamine 5'-phosphate oxidase superfamily)